MCNLKAGCAVSGPGNDRVTRDFARYLAIVNSFIRCDSHLEINIGSDIKRDIMDYIKFDAYLALEPVSRGRQCTDGFTGVVRCMP